MKSILAAAVVALTCLCAPVSNAAITLVQWTFESNPPADLISGTTGGIPADFGAGSIIGSHVDSFTEWTTPDGNGSGNSLSATRWAANDYFEFQISTVSFFGIQVTWEQTRNATGPGSFKLTYSIDGSSFVDISTYTVSSVNWSSGSPAAGSSFGANLSSIAAINDNSSVYFRLIATEAGSDSAGTSQIDDFIVSVIPEPAEWGLICAAGMLGVCGLRAWQQRRRAMRQLHVTS
jgi:hypothetical protein